MSLKHALILILSISVLVKCENGQVSQTDSDVYIFEHSIDTHDFKEIGQLNIRTIRQNQIAAQLQNAYDENTDENRYTSSNSNVFTTQIESNDFDAESLEQLLTYKNKENNKQCDALYRLRLCKKGHIVGLKTCLTSTFTYLKNVIDSNMKINLTVYTGVNNFINSISIKTLSFSKDIDTKKLRKSDFPNHLDLFVYIQNIKTAVGPDTESYLEKVKKEMEQKEKSAQGGNDSFLSKYWIYIVPVVIVMFLMNLANPEGGGAPGGQ